MTVYFIGAGPGFGQTLTTADVNGDGRLDIITPHVFGFLWLENQPGASSFQAHANFIPGFSVYNRILAGDLDRDGAVDVVLTTFSGSLFVMNQGDGLFDPPQTLGDHFGEGILVDLDLDGDLDLLASRIQGGGRGVLAGEHRSCRLQRQWSPRLPRYRNGRKCRL